METQPPGRADDQLVVFWTRRTSTCDECHEESPPGAFIRVVQGSAVCLACADLDHLVFLPRGDTALTRRARKHSSLSAVVVRWSSSRRRYERQGLLVEEPALELAETECLSDADRRAAQRERSAAARERQDERLVGSFGEAILRRYPGCPDDVARSVAERACARGSGRVGRSAAGRELADEAIDRALRAHVRHSATAYDGYLMSGWDRHDARAAVREAVDDVIASWLRPRELAARPRVGLRS
jgi:hypothetical protein